ncbi:hypothetical protein [Terriglobus sp. ADX1]|uniref:hypothetical protein n=1 Tax=Terriglobus sp. ADX1 TaxID=2794063 RepID=UPI002FE6167B
MNESATRHYKVALTSVPVDADDRLHCRGAYVVIWWQDDIFDVAFNTEGSGDGLLVTLTSA